MALDVWCGTFEVLGCEVGFILNFSLVKNNVFQREWHQIKIKDNNIPDWVQKRPGAGPGLLRQSRLPVQSEKAKGMYSATKWPECFA